MLSIAHIYAREATAQGLSTPLPRRISGEGMIRGSIWLACLALVACDNAPHQSTPTRTDTAIAAAIADPILTDQQLAIQSDGGGDPAPGMAIPRELSPLGDPRLPPIATITNARRPEVCASAQPGFSWMAQLPVGLTLPASAQVVDAAGSDVPQCHLRGVRFVDGAPPPTILARYAGALRRIGMAVNLRAGALSAAARDGRTVELTTRAHGGGTLADLVSTTR